ncbi:malignant fibrous histiocytoma-amplified sequence 1 homolog [Corticium candelabrum]|uniref:malignant fibrous histiocytoma-amplified sequence 1 homolog n=1 Tax=Corticium candelabrum TaxID=121492 RepID=UPI002E270086|nr:malignant fibrous histiocytoma-amplified sequence 1 homolog [Corticium candelabrum]
MALPRVEARQLEMFLPKVNEHNRLELDLLDAHLFAFPEEICETSGLEVLKLCTDHIHSIPEGIAKLRKLEEIHLHTSDYHDSRTSYFSPRLPPIGLQEVPTVVSLLPCLKVLSVCGNCRNPLLFDELMSCQLPSTLVEVEMVACCLTQATLSMICNNVKLCKVNLARNNLQSFKCCNTEMIREATVLNDLEELDLCERSFRQVGSDKYMYHSMVDSLGAGMAKQRLIFEGSLSSGGEFCGIVDPAMF